MTNRFAVVACSSFLATFLYLWNLGASGHAAADEAHVIYFNEGVLGANEAKAEPRPILLPSPDLKIVFSRLSTLTLTPSETVVVDKLASALAGLMNMSAAALEVMAASFALESTESEQPFDATELPENQLVVLFADVERHSTEMEAILDAAHGPLAQRHAGLWTETRAMFRCGLFLFRTRQQAISAILFIAPDETLATASYCVSFATLETAGFRGRVTSLSKEACKSPRCAAKPRTSIQAWDYLALSALYGVEDPKPITALYRFKELFKAAPQSLQSPD